MLLWIPITRIFPATCSRALGNVRSRVFVTNITTNGILPFCVSFLFIALWYRHQLVSTVTVNSLTVGDQSQPTLSKMNYELWMST